MIPPSIITWLTGKVAGPVFGIALLAMSIAFAITIGVYHFELSSETARADKLDLAINAQGTGWVARNTQCLTNFGNVSAALKRTSDDIERLAKDTAAANASNALLMATAVRQVRGVRASTDKLLSTPATAPPGTLAACTSAARILKTGAP